MSAGGFVPTSLPTPRARKILRIRSFNGKSAEGLLSFSECQDGQYVHLHHFSAHRDWPAFEQRLQGFRRWLHAAYDCLVSHAFHQSDMTVDLRRDRLESEMIGWRNVVRGEEQLALSAQLLPPRAFPIHGRSHSLAYQFKENLHPTSNFVANGSCWLVT
jgi:hypothetical protein